MSTVRPPAFIAPLLSEVSIHVGTDTQLSLLDVRIWQPYVMRVMRFSLGPKEGSSFVTIEVGCASPANITAYSLAVFRAYTSILDHKSQIVWENIVEVITRE